MDFDGIQSGTTQVQHPATVKRGDTQCAMARLSSSLSGISPWRLPGSGCQTHDPLNAIRFPAVYTRLQLTTTTEKPDSSRGSLSAPVVSCGSLNP